MRYTQFQIQNFKGIKQLDLELSREPNASIFTLVGLNESGKSTILEAIHWFHDSSSYDPHDLIPKGHRGNFNGTISVKAIIELSEADDAEITTELDSLGYIKTAPLSSIAVTRYYDYSASARVSEGSFWNVTLMSRPKDKRRAKPTDLSSKNPAWQALVKYIRTKMFPPVVYYQNFLFDFPDKIYLQDKSSPYREVVQDVLNSIDTSLTIDKHLVERHQNGQSSSLDAIQAVLDDASARITEVVISAWRDIVKKTDAQLSISLGSTIYEDTDGLYLQLKVKEGRNTFYIRERSLGFRWFFSFVMFTHFRTFRDNQRENALFLLDEPASNLHPAAQTKLLTVFPSLPNNQVVIYSTHSHHMINPAWLGGAYVVRNAGQDYSGLGLSYNAAKTEILARRYFQYVADYPQDTDFFRPILDALEFQPGPLEMIPDLVIVEGKNDYYTLRYMREVMELSGSGTIAMYPSTGKDKVDTIIGLYLAWGRNFQVLLDADRGGTDTARRLEKDFGALVQGRVSTLADIDADWSNRAFEDLIEESDKQLFVDQAFPGGTVISKSKLNTGIQSCFVRGVKLPLSEKTVSSFARILEYLTKGRTGSAP